MDTDQFKAVLKDELDGFRSGIDLRIAALEENVAKSTPAADTSAKDEMATAISVALQPIVEAVEGLTKDRDGIGDAVNKSFDRLEAVEKHLAGRQSVPDVSPEPEAVEKKGPSLSDAVGAALRGRTVVMS